VELIFEKKTIKFNGQPSYDEIIKTINELLGEHYYLSHLIINGEKIYENIERYIADRLEKIVQIELVAKMQKEFIGDILLNSLDYINRARPEMIKLAESFYNNISENHWNDFESMLEGLQWLNRMLVFIKKTEEQLYTRYDFENVYLAIETEVKNLKDAVTNQDNVLIADIIQYELIPIYFTLAQEIEKIIDKEGYSNDIE
jgi:hypothetical protein